MCNDIKNILFLLALSVVLFNSHEIFAQSLRGLVNDGVENYDKGNFSDAEVNFKKGVEKAPDNFQAKFNLGDAYFKQKRYDEAVKSYQSALPLARSNNEKAQVYYNVGNSLLKAQKIKESIEEYKKSLKLNPNDQEAKYNLSYALEMLKNQDQQEKDKDEKEDKKEDQQKEQEQEKKDQQKDEQNKQDQPKDNDKQKQQPQQQKISKEEAERILEALKENEKDLQKELRKIKGKRVKTDKDW
ncbi:MAG: tetratricopeptide repeat protein [Bacteroidetes bacterium]|nr:tetratricopeptide repeat protein [Bacteroidota bacterium]